ncbi:MAG: hypothetical protein D6718_02635 [Acidobacteria bacterium]|nr:MAG: hypothetical protein D6718_02635 [Acidobacteriota bacterium]
MPDERVLLEELAASYGLLPRHTDGLGRPHDVGSETLLALLVALGAPVRRMEDVPAALAERRSAAAGRLVDPVVSWFQGEPPAFEVRLAPGEAEGPLHVTIELEDGRQVGSPIGTPPSGGPGPRTARVPFPPIPPGLHRLRCRTARRRAEARLIAAPRRAHPASGPTWGLAVALPSLRSARNLGRGDLADLRRLAAWAAGRGAGYVGVLPLLAAMDDEASPYRPASRLAWDEAFLPVDRLPELALAPSARALLASPGFAALRERQRRGALVDHAGVRSLVRSVLAPIAEAVWTAGGGAREEIERFRRLRPFAEAYARHRAGEGGDPRLDLYAQFAMERELSGFAPRGAGGAALLLDLPLGIHPRGFDAAFRPDLFVRGVRLGAPPDAFHVEGQSWDLPPWHPERSADEGHEHFALCLEHQMRFAGALRIDHVMGLFRQYWIPAGFPADEGAYLRFPGRDLTALATLLSHRHRCALVGEDLGTVPPEVRRTMELRGWARTYAFVLETRPPSPLPDPPPGSCAGLSTHDTATFAGFWSGADIARRLAGDPRRARLEIEARRRHCARLARILGAPAEKEAVLDRLLDWLSAGPAAIVLASLDDLCLDPEPLNVPGTALERPNWRKRTALTLEEIERDPVISARVGRLRRP